MTHMTTRDLLSEIEQKEVKIIKGGGNITHLSCGKYYVAHVVTNAGFHLYFRDSDEYKGTEGFIHVVPRKKAFVWTRILEALIGLRSYEDDYDSIKTEKWLARIG